MSQCPSVMTTGARKPRSARPVKPNLVHAVFAWLNENPAFTSSYVRDLHSLVRYLPSLAADSARRKRSLDEKLDALFAEAVEAGVLVGDVALMRRTLRALMWGLVEEDMLHGRERKDWTGYAPIIVRIMMRAFAPEGGQR